MQTHSSHCQAFGLEPQYREYVWGGNRLRPGQQTAEAWIVHQNNRITSGMLAGSTLADAVNLYGSDLLGQQVSSQKFPLLIKLLDCADWLSVQVHPNDQQAVQLEGDGHNGKTEAWFMLEADPGAKIMCGFKPGASEEAVRQSVRDGSILEHIQAVTVHTGDTIFIRAGTVHALGPGMLVYEVQQDSDITYRVFDWNRPATAGRKLHIEQSLAVMDDSASGKALPEPPFADGAHQRLVACPYFTLELLTAEENALYLDTGAMSFHALTVIEGKAEVSGQGWRQTFGLYETAFVPACCGAYQITPLGKTRILKSSAGE